MVRCAVFFVVLGLFATTGQAALVSMDFQQASNSTDVATVIGTVGDHREADLLDGGQNSTDDQIGVWAGAGSTNWWNYGVLSATALVDADGNTTTLSYTITGQQGTAKGWTTSPVDDLLLDGIYKKNGIVTTTISGLTADTTYDLIVYHNSQHVSEIVTVNGASAVDYTGSLANPGYDDAFEAVTGSDFWFFREPADSSGNLVIVTSGTAGFNVLTGFQLAPVPAE